ncbi:SitI3 family protein [Streptomyces sp. NPDC020917]|uniref:SitI3 family protein n=1 Tax=Streptomyces sp. NPDC020917 TaxID=3365102 RepID=UPI00379056FC
MALAHSFSIATPLPPERIAHELKDIGAAAGLLDAAVTPESLLGEGAVTVGGTYLRVVEKRPQPWSPLVTDLGITPSVGVAFRLAKHMDLARQEDDVVRLACGLLRRIPGDAVLQYHVETVWLLRRGDDLSLDERDDLWSPRRLGEVPAPFRRATHAFSED